jgi:hypothetical protein
MITMMIMHLCKDAVLTTILGLLRTVTVERGVRNRSVLRYLPAVTGLIDLHYLPAVTGLIDLRYLPAVTGLIDLSYLPEVTGLIDLRYE